MTTFERKPFASALIAALALISSSSFAETTESDTTLSVQLGDADDATKNIIGKTISSSVDWNKDWAKRYGNEAAKTLQITGKDGSQAFNVVKDGSLTNNLETVELMSVQMSVNEGAFVNNGTLKLDQNCSLTITKPVGFDNRKGTIESKGNVTIEDSGLTDALEKAPESIYMGNITVSGSNVALKNNDQGYTLKSDKKTTTPSARVVFGNVTLKDGAKFEQGDKAMDIGETMTIGQGSSMSVKGQSDWKNIIIDGADAKVNLNNTGKVNTNEFTINKVSADQNFENFVNGTGTDFAFNVKEALTIKSFDQDASFTIDGCSAMHGVTLASNTSLNLGSLADFKQDDTSHQIVRKDYNQGTITLTQLNAAWTEKPKDAQADTKPEGTWTNHTFGTITVNNNANLILSANRLGTMPEGQYKPSIEIGQLNFISSSMKLNYKIDTDKVIGDIKTTIGNNDLTAPDGIDNWTSKDLKANLTAWIATLEPEQQQNVKDALKAQFDAYAEKFKVDEITATSSSHTITGSDIYIKSLSFDTKQTEVTGDYSKFAVTTVAEDSKPEAKDQIDISENFDSLGSHTLTIKDSSNVEVGSLALNTGVLNVEGNDTKFIVHDVKKINGTFTAQSGYVGLNVDHSMADYVTSQNKAQSTNLTLEVNGPVVLGESANVTFGGSSTKKDATQDGGASLTFKGDSTLKFDAAKLNKNALFVAEGKTGTLTTNGAKVNVNATNLSWGRYNLFENFEGNVAEGTFEKGDLTASDMWKDQLGTSGDNIKLEVGEDGNVSIIVGSESVKGSGLNVNAQNLVSTIFSGDRASADDIVFVNNLLHSGSSLAEVSHAINTATGLGAISGVKALSIDFAGYTADQIEHHASTMPHNMGGWWIQPLGTRMKTDDLAMGGSTYGYSLDAYGLMGGYDIHRGDWTFGMAASYQSGDADSEGNVLPVSTSLKSKAAHLWGAKTYGETYVIGTFSYIQTDGETEATIANQSLSADIKATAFSAGVRAERNFAFGGLTLTPHVGARVTTVDLDDYTIDMDNKKLFSVNEDKATIFEVPVGLAVKTQGFMFQTFNVQPYVDVTFRGRFGDTDSSYTLQGSKTTDNIDYAVAGDFVGDLKVGYMSTYKNLNLGMSYGLSAGDAGRQNHSLEATLRVDF